MEQLPNATTPAVQQRGRRLSLSVIVASLIVALIVAGSSWASITGGGIVDGTVSSADIKNGSITGADVRDGSLTRTDLGTTERSEIVERINQNTVTLGVPLTTVASQTLSRGSWLVTGSAQFANADGVGPNYLYCVLRSASPAMNYAERSVQLARSGDYGSQQVVSLSTLITLPAQTSVSYKCSGGPSLSAFSGQLIAIRAGKATRNGIWPFT